MRFILTFFTSALISSIAIAAAINEQGPGNDVTGSTTYDPDSNVLGVAPVHNDAHFEDDINKFIRRTRKYTKSFFGQYSASAIAVELRADLEKLISRSAQVELSEAASNQLHFAEYIANTIETAAQEINPLVGSSDAASWALRSLIQIKVDVLILQSAPGVLSLERPDFKTALLNAHRQVNSAKFVFRQAENVSDETSAQYEAYLIEASDLLLALSKQAESSS